MTNPNLTRTSKFLSLILRHDPGKVGIKLDAQGWTSVEGLLAGMTKKGRALTLEDLQAVVAGDTKQRYAFNADQTMIRASQGHSVKVEFEYPPATPPELLYHGTVERFMVSIRAEGLKPKNRHHVHLSRDVETARTVGARRGKPVILCIDARRMAAPGHVFYLSNNGVWLTEAVPTTFITKL